MPLGSAGHRWGDKGKWNLEEKDGQGREVRLRNSLADDHDAIEGAGDLPDDFMAYRNARATKSWFMFDDEIVDLDEFLKSTGVITNFQHSPMIRAAVTKVKGLLERDKVDFVVGPIFSNVAVAVHKPIVQAA